MKKFTFISVLAIFSASNAFAISLEDARKAGSVGETLNGYVAAVKSSPDVDAMVKEVNAKRKAHYQGISKENGQPINVVEKLAAEKLIANPEVGYIQNSDGSWKKK